MSTTESAGVEVVDEDRVVASGTDAATQRDADLASRTGTATTPGASDTAHATTIAFRVRRGRPRGRRIPSAAAQTSSAQTASTSCCIDEREAAKYIGMSVPFLRKARRMGRGPSYYRIGHAVRYRVADLDDWLAMHRVTTRDRAA